jgi:hypothetical protein
MDTEPTLTIKLSDRNEFHCSVCGHEVISAPNSRFIVNRVTDLIAAFKYTRTSAAPVRSDHFSQHDTRQPERDNH